MRYKDETKKESIAQAAIQLINEIGLAETSMSKIAQKAGVSAATIYVYFENKNDMIKELFLTVKQDMQQKIFYDIQDSMPTKMAFELLLKNYMGYFLNNKAYFLFYEQCINSPLVHSLCRDEAQVLVKPIMDFLEKGKAQYIFKQVDTYLIFVSAFSSAIQFAKNYFNGGYPLSDKVVATIIQMGWDAVRA